MIQETNLKPYIYHSENHRFPLVVSIPHSGTQFGQTCSPAFSARLRVAENQPFAGGYLTKHYGADAQIEAAQIKLWYAYYIDHRTFGKETFPKICPTVFAEAQQHLQSFFKNLWKEQRICQ